MSLTARLRDPAPFTLLIACLGFFVVVLDTTAVNVALEDIRDDLGAGISGLQWVVDAYTVVFAALLLSAGALADRIGATRAFAAGMAVFVLSSAACALAPSLGVLIAMRVLQGAAAAVMLPSSLALASRAYQDPALQRRSISIWTAAGAAAITAGPVIGGLLTEWLGWRAVFFINLPVGIAALLAVRHLAASAPRPAALDLVGQTCAVLTLACLTFGVIEGAHRGFDEPIVAGALALSAVALLLFVRIETTTAEPVLPLKLFAGPTAATALAVCLVLYLAFYGEVFILALFFQEVLGHGPAVAGLLFLPLTALSAASTLVCGRMVGAFGTWVPMALGFELMAIGLMALTAIDASSGTLAISLAIAPLGLGMGFAGPPIPMALMAALPAERAGIASGAFNCVRQTGATLGVAIFGALAAAGSGFVDGMHHTLYVGIFTSAVSLVAVVLFLRGPAPAAAPA